MVDDISLPTDPYSFKFAKEWKFSVPMYQDPAANGLDPHEVVVLTASDGGGHNKAIPNLLELAIQNRQEYCDYHGYRCVWFDSSKYDMNGAHKVIPSHLSVATWKC